MRDLSLKENISLLSLIKRLYNDNISYEYNQKDNELYIYLENDNFEDFYSFDLINRKINFLFEDEYIELSTNEFINKIYDIIDRMINFEINHY